MFLQHSARTVTLYWNAFPPESKAARGRPCASWAAPYSTRRQVPGRACEASPAVEI